MRWDNLQILLAISRESSLTRAAQFLGLDQSTAGRRLNQLEADLGVVLFVRSKSGFAATQAGEAAIARAIEIEMSINGLVDEVSVSNKSAVGTVRLVGNAWTLARLARKAVPKLLIANPKLNIRTISLLRSSHVRGEASVAIWFEKSPERGEFSVALGEIPFAVYQSASTQTSNNWVSFYDEDVPRPAIARRVAELRGKDEVIRFTGTDASVFQGAIAGGVGRGLLPMCLGEEDPSLERVSNGAPELMRTLWLHAHPDTVETMRVKVTLDWLREEFANAFTH